MELAFLGEHSYTYATPVDGALTDLRFAVRQLVRLPGYATVAILTLALAVASA